MPLHIDNAGKLTKITSCLMNVPATALHHTSFTGHGLQTAIFFFNKTPTRGLVSFAAEESVLTVQAYTSSSIIIWTVDGRCS
jgi:hypothetical protein